MGISEGCNGLLRDKPKDRTIEETKTRQFRWVILNPGPEEPPPCTFWCFPKSNSSYLTYQLTNKRGLGWTGWIKESARLWTEKHCSRLKTNKQTKNNWCIPGCAPNKSKMSSVQSSPRNLDLLQVLQWNELSFSTQLKLYQVSPFLELALNCSQNVLYALTPRPSITPRPAMKICRAKSSH